MVNLVVELVAGLLVGTVLMHVSAKIADVDDATLLRALEAAGIGIILVVVSDMVYLHSRFDSHKLKYAI